MTIRKIIIIEERKVFKKPTNLCKTNGENTWYLFTDLTTQSTGIIPEYQLKKNYSKMNGTSKGRECYMERLKELKNAHN